MSATLSNDYWLERKVWEQSVHDMFREDFPELAPHPIKVCENGVVFVYMNRIPGLFRGYPTFRKERP